jgi:hypothetical protein
VLRAVGWRTEGRWWVWGNRGMGLFLRCERNVERGWVYYCIGCTEGRRGGGWVSVCSLLKSLSEKGRQFIFMH